MQFISILTGVLNGLTVWALIGWIFTRGTKGPGPACRMSPAKKYSVLFPVFFIFAIISDFFMYKLTVR